MIPSVYPVDDRTDFSNKQVLKVYALCVKT